MAWLPTTAARIAIARTGHLNFSKNTWKWDIKLCKPTEMLVNWELTQLTSKSTQRIPDRARACNCAESMPSSSQNLIWNTKIQFIGPELKYNIYRIEPRSRLKRSSSAVGSSLCSFGWIKLLENYSGLIWQISSWPWAGPSQPAIRTWSYQCLALVVCETYLALYITWFIYRIHLL